MGVEHKFLGFRNDPIGDEEPSSIFFFLLLDAALYALGVGACGRDALDKYELKYVYHEDGQQSIQVLPTFGVLFAVGFLSHLSHVPGLQCKIKQASPDCMIKVRLEGKAAILEVEVISYEKESSEPICLNRMTVYLRGAGGFSKSSHPYSYSKNSASQNLAAKIPNRQPFAALLYRLSGDYNPLHSDPKVAEIAGFSRPIQHGLCTMGFAVRAIIKCICGGDPNMIKNISGRFLLHVYPGETLIMEMWLEGLRVVYQVKVKERNKAVLSGVIDLTHLTSSL
ncbi:hypothetical protein HYC85_008791 [Camellia sinensis]|uniref:MaoC-like domain-containing protein n=1 Tax=Camellia sinensis TaxID=4442 RepID=A0A7J7HTU9_CAMSI|nr:hypothetical protein HYC85_008791 [Camellia sinensis]